MKLIPLVRDFHARTPIPPALVPSVDTLDSKSVSIPLRAMATHVRAILKRVCASTCTVEEARHFAALEADDRCRLREWLSWAAAFFECAWNDTLYEEQLKQCAVLNTRAATLQSFGTHFLPALLAPPLVPDKGLQELQQATERCVLASALPVTELIAQLKWLEPHWPALCAFESVADSLVARHLWNERVRSAFVAPTVARKPNREELERRDEAELKAMEKALDSKAVRYIHFPFYWNEQLNSLSVQRDFFCGFVCGREKKRGRNTVGDVG